MENISYQLLLSICHKDKVDKSTELKKMKKKGPIP